MSSCYRVEYASASPRTECTACHRVIRSGEVRLMCYHTYRHAECMTALDVLKMWQQCKSFEHVPGFSQLEYADRTQIQQLFRALLVSTPAQSRSRMAAAAAAAAASAATAATLTAAQSPPPSSHAADYSGHLYREPSNDASMMMESPPSGMMSAASSASPPLLLHELMPPQAIAPALSPSAASSSVMPPGQPQLTSAHSMLAGHLSTLTCSTQPNMQQQSPAASLLSPSGVLAPRALPRDASSTHTSPSLHGRNVSAGAGGFDSRSVSPFGLLSLQPLPQYPGGMQPTSPHSSHTSPVPFAQLQLSGGMRQPPGSGGQSIFSPPSASASSSSSSHSSAAFHHGAVGALPSAALHSAHRPALRSKRKLDSSIPEEEAPSQSAGGGLPHSADAQTDDMMDQGANGSSSNHAMEDEQMSGKRRRTAEQQLAQQQHAAAFGSFVVRS